MNKVHRFNYRWECLGYLVACLIMANTVWPDLFVEFEPLGEVSTHGAGHPPMGIIATSTGGSIIVGWHWLSKDADDGSVFLLEDGQTTYVKDLPGFENQQFDVNNMSTDGSVLVGVVGDYPNVEAFRWENGVIERLGVLLK